MIESGTSGVPSLWRVRFLRLSRSVSSAIVLLVTGCLPIPNRVTDVVEVVGTLSDCGRPLAGREVSVDQPKYDGAGTRAACSGTAPVRTDSAGFFHSPRRTKWVPVVSLIGESPEWRIPVRVCVRLDSGWRETFSTHTNGWDEPLRVSCDLARRPYRDDRNGDEGICTATDSTQVSARRDSTRIEVRGPTLIAFWPPNAQAALDSGGDAATALDDFGYYLASADSALRALGFRVASVGGPTLHLITGARTATFLVPRDSADPGYYIVAPGQPPAISYGVQTDADLVDAARRYLTRINGSAAIRR